MKVAVVQMVSSPDVADNLRTAQQLLDHAAQQGAQLVVLPEYFCGMGLRDTDKLHWSEALGDGPLQSALSQWAAMYGIWLVGGTIPLQTQSPQRVRNTSLLFSPDGTQAAHYDKIHLFRFQTEHEHYDESVVIEPGATPVVVPITDQQGHTWKLGMSVCYDLRFPELYRQQAAQGADILLAPSAFTHTTGQAHWEVLLRARAIENQCWMLAAAQGGQHANGRLTWGHSMVIDPWGEILAQCTQPGPGTACAVLDLALLRQVRSRLPALEHRVL